MTRPIGYYVHHHGDGHRRRALAVAAFDPVRFVLLGTGLAGRVGDIAAIDLPDDRLAGGGAFDGDDGEQDRPHALHYAPLNHDGVRDRMTAIAQWIAQARPALMVADVSVEVAMLARLCATPVAYVRLGGRRDDAPHLESYRAASVLIAPFAETLDDPGTPGWIRQKTFYARGVVARPANVRPRSGMVVVVYGRGGSTFTASDIIEAARSTPTCQWRVIGLSHGATDLPLNLAFLGWIEHPEIEIARAEIVVGAAGDGLVGAVLAARRPFVCIPEPRPFGEQIHKAAALERAGAAVVAEKWPNAAQWSGIFDAARAIDPEKQALLDDSDGTARFARMLIDLADRQK